MKITMILAVMVIGAMVVGIIGKDAFGLNIQTSWIKWGFVVFGLPFYLVAFNSWQKLGRIMANLGKTEVVGQAKIGERTTVDFQYAGTEQAVVYKVGGKEYKTELTLVLPFEQKLVGKTVLYNKNNPQEAVVDSWVEKYAILAIASVWLIASIGLILI